MSAPGHAWQRDQLASGRHGNQDRPDLPVPGVRRLAPDYQIPDQAAGIPEGAAQALAPTSGAGCVNKLNFLLRYAPVSHPAFPEAANI